MNPTIFNSMFKPGTTAAVALAAALASGGTAVAHTGAAAPDDPDRQTLQLTLDEAMRRAIEKNPDLAIVRLDTEVEAARVSESRGAYAPLFSTTIGRSSSATPPSNILLGDRGVNVGDWFSSAGVRQRLPWGSGTWAFSWDASRTTTNVMVVGNSHRSPRKARMAASIA